MDKKTEAIFLMALLQEGTDVIERVTNRVVEYRDNPPTYVKEMLERIELNGDES